MQFSSLGFDERGLFSFREGEKLCHNPFEISMQAMLGKKILDDYRDVSGMLVSRYYSIDDLPDVTGDEYAKIAMDWLLEHAREIENTLIVDYDFDAEYEGQWIYAPWHSAFGQAYFVLALLCWGCWTNKNYYNQLAEKAARGLVLDLEKGGCSVSFGGGIWFEEMPQENMTHIFNAHLIALIALLELQLKLNLRWTREYIEKGIVAFSSCAEKMDSGVSSVYDMPAFRSGFLQLLPADSAIDIWLKSIRITTAESKCLLDLSVNDCFEPGKELWIAGIDWSEQDEYGYRKLLFGESLRFLPTDSGTRQNTFLHLKNIPNQSNVFEITVEYKCAYDSILYLRRSNGVGGYCGLGFMDEIALPAGKGFASLTLPMVVLSPPIHQSYHTFHITLLEELTRLSGIRDFVWLIEKFRRYNDERWVYLNKKPCKNPTLSSVSVTVNKRCGLFCKMCDLGIENSRASIFRNLRSEKDLINSELLVARCIEAKPELRTVHFVGTEVTLYKPFPNLVKELRNGGLEVLATTNGIALSKMLPKLLEADLNCLYISIDGPEAIHDGIRGKKGLFQSILNCLENNKEIIRKAKKGQGFKLRIGCAITPMNYLYLPELVGALRQASIDGIDCTHMNFVLPSTVDKHNAKSGRFQIEESCTYPEMAPGKVNPYLMRYKILEAQDMAKKSGIEFTSVPQMQTYLEFQDFYKRPNICVGARRCTVADRHLQINADGIVCVMSRCYQFSIGSIYKNSLKELFHSKEMIDFRSYINEQIYEPCYHCCGIME